MTMNNSRRVTIPCIECSRKLRFRTEAGVVVEGDGIIACNIPAVVCPECVESVMSRVADPPGLICVDGLSVEMAVEMLQSFAFVLPTSEATAFFEELFPKVRFEKST
jgi:glycerol-3-phosphate dehydrogenase